jgi:hypothetical protein
LPKQEHEIRKRTSQLDESELEIAEDGLELNLSSNSMAMKFQNRTGFAIDPSKLQNYHMKQQQQSNSLDSFFQMTPAEQVVQQLSSSKHVSFAYLVAIIEVGEELVTTYTHKKTKPNLTIMFESNVTTNGKPKEPKLLSPSEIMAMSNDVAFADGEMPESTACDIYGSL